MTGKAQEAELILRLLHSAVDREASDIHLISGYPPTFRVHGVMVNAEGPTLDHHQIHDMAATILPVEALRRIESEKSVDCSIAIEHLGRPCRFRANLFYAQGDLCLCLRHIPGAIPTFTWMGFPEGIARKLSHLTNGLVILTGITGSGKTTSLAAMVNMLNEEGGYRIITVEEPVEYLHPRKSSTIVTQREIGRDVESFYEGLRSGLRQDPDVILVGEIRDRETAQMGLSAAETGHLILTTMHTRDAKGAITRFVDLFPHDAHDDVRTQLSLSLRAVVSQHLIPASEEGTKRVLALEIMMVTQPVRIGIRFGKIDSIESAIQTGKKDGMLSLDDHLDQLLREGRISPQTALKYAKDPQSIPGLARHR